MNIKVSIAPEVLFTLGNFNVTNALFTGFVIFFLIVLFFLIFKVTYNIKKPSKFHLVIEMVILGMFNFLSNMLGREKGIKLFSFLTTFFVFALVSNWFGLLPTTLSTFIGTPETTTTSTSQSISALVTKVQAQTNTLSVNTDIAATNVTPSLGECLSQKDCYLTTQGIVKFKDEKPLFRSPTSDLSLTVALALVSVIITNIIGFTTMRKGFLKKYFNYTSFINGFVSLLETISEFAKILSFSFRLFGNVFAGEMLLTIITSLSYGVFSLPILVLELFVSVIQALVFFMLTAVLIGLATTEHGGHREHETKLDLLLDEPLSP